MACKCKERRERMLAMAERARARGRKVSAAVIESAVSAIDVAAKALGADEKRTDDDSSRSGNGKK